MIRILFQNPQGLGPINSDKYRQSTKINKLKDTLIKHNVDIVGLSEINKDWRKIPHQETLWACMEGWFEHKRLTISINQSIPATSMTQFGGTILLATNRIAYSISESAQDFRKLGRWTSILINGKNNRRSRIICAYCPCRSSGPSSTYALQVVGLAKCNIFVCPRIQFWLDLKCFISSCQEANDQVIVMGDWNSSYEEVVQWMSTVGLKDIIVTRHNREPPPTCARSSEGPIDAIFCPNSFTCWRGGYLAFDYLEGDHRGLWCDIPVEFLLGYNMQHPAHAAARRLKTTDPRIRKKYLRAVHKDLVQQNIYEKMKDLYTSMQHTVLPTDIIKFEEIDTVVNTTMEKAEKKCRKLRTGIVPWSPLYQQACDKVTYWQLVYDEKIGKKVNIRKIRSLRKKLKIRRDITLTSDVIENKLKLAIQNRKRCKRYGPELQIEYRHRLARAKEEEDNIPAAVHIKNLTQQENTRALFRRIRYLERKMANLSTARVIISDRQGQQREIIQKQLIERHIICSNQRKYHQTEGHCPLNQGQLLKDIGLLGDGPKVKDILHGTYRFPPGTSTLTKSFLKQLTYPDNRNECPGISFEEYKQGWIKTKEKTSSCGLHYGHFKSAMHHAQLALLLYYRAMIPMMTGYSPKRHRQGIDVMLLKKENSFHVDSLRTIVLFDSEANMNYKHIGRRAMKLALEKSQIATEQYSRPQRKAIDHALNRKLIMDHQLYSRQPYAMTSCDLKSCYDRIVHSSASMALQRLGIPKTEVVSMFDSIQRMNHKVRTSFGDSTVTYGGSVTDRRWKLPPQGVLQGNGCGPSIWAILSSVIFAMLRQHGFQNTFESAVRRVTLDLAGFAYVDDSDLIQVEDSVRQVVMKMQNKLKTWIEAIRVTGGVLAPHKCWWYLVHFQYKRGRWRACLPREDFRLWIKNPGEERVEVKKLEPSKGMNMLGVLLAPDGNVKEHVQYLKTKAEHWASSVMSSHSNKEEIWTALHRTIPFAMAYSLSVSTLTKEECRAIMSPIYKVGLPRAGISSTTPHAVRSGPITRGGLGLLDAYTYMGVSKVETLVSNIWKRTPTGRLLEIALEDIALEMGLQDTWETPTLKQGLLYATTPSWIRHLFIFTTDNDIHLQIDIKLFHRRRRNDRTIMEVALEYTTNPSILRSINAIRMSLKVVWMSDIVSADGTVFDGRCVTQGRVFPSRNNHRWPKQHHITPKDWTEWRQWIASASHGDRHTVAIPLGVWMVQPAEWISTWDCFIISTNKELYIRQNDGKTWRRHILIPGRIRHFHRYYLEYIEYRDLPCCPTILKRASVVLHRRYLEAIAIAENNPERPTAAQPSYPWNDIRSTKASILGKIREILDPVYCEASASIQLLLQDFMTGQAVAVSDGSYFSDTNRAAAAWIIISKCNTQWIRGSMLTPGPTKDFNAYRSELTGLLAITVTIKILSCCVSQPNHIIIGCDGAATLKALQSRREEVSMSLPHADLRSIIVDLWSTVTLLPFPVHIKGHQDTNNERPLTRLEVLNVWMDKLATLTASSYHNPGEYLEIPNCSIPRVQIGDTGVAGELHKSLYNAMVARNMDEYLTTKSFQGTPTIVATIDFESFKKARIQAPVYMQIFITKWISNTLPTGKVMQLRKQRIFNRCPRCNAWGEDKLHVLTCWDARAKVIWDRQMEVFTQFLTQEHTCPEITDYLLTGLEEFCNHPNNPIGAISSWTRELRSIGWINVVTGFLGKQLILKQSYYYKNMGSRKTGSRWGSKIILQLWGLIHKMWLGRNDVLHRKDIINSISGQCLLDIELEREYDAGYEDLPRVVHKWFQQSKEQLMARSVEYKKGWLLIVKTVKEARQIADYSIFTSSVALRRWIGLRDS